jgi:hypothetical protein
MVLCIGVVSLLPPACGGKSSTGSHGSVGGMGGGESGAPNHGGDWAEEAGSGGKGLSNAGMAGTVHEGAFGGSGETDQVGGATGTTVVAKGGRDGGVGGQGRGGNTSGGTSGSGNGGTAGAREQSGGNAGTANGGSSPGVGGQVVAAGAGPVCEDHVPMDAPAIATDCPITERVIDESTVCDATCPITKSLDIACSMDSGPRRVIATTEGAVLQLADRLVTINNDGQEVHALPQNEFLLARTQTGQTWFIGRKSSERVEVHRNGNTWTSATIRNGVESYGTSADEFLVVDDARRYALSSQSYSEFVTLWDQSCWHDVNLDFDRFSDPAIGVDTQGNLQVAVNAHNDTNNTVELHLLDSDGLDTLVWETEEGDTSSAPWEILEIVPGGYSGSELLPLIVTRQDDGIHILHASEDDIWENRLLSSMPGLSVLKDTDCPSDFQAPGIGMAYGNCAYSAFTCHSAITGFGDGLQVVRAASGGLFAVWVEYEGEGSHVYSEHCWETTNLDGGFGELLCDCQMDSQSFAGTADVVVARLTETELVSTRLHFPMDSALFPATGDNMAAATQDNTLVLSASFAEAETSAGVTSYPKTLYLEIDTSQLP